MREIISGSFAKELDKYAITECGIPSLALMERAAHAVCERAEAVLSTYKDTVFVFCGTGNNGADGLAAGAMLLADGYIAVSAFCCGDPAKGSEEFSIQKKRFLEAGGILKIVELDMLRAVAETEAAPALLIDALFGIGLKRPVTGVFADVVETMNLLRNAGSYVISVDMPSGIDADGGKNMCAPLYPVHADETVTFGYAKTGQYLDYGYGNCGLIHVAEIGYPAELPVHDRTDQALPVFRSTEEVFSEQSEAFLHRDGRANKGTYRKLLIIAGAKGMAGAAYLSGLAAYRSGIGMVKYFGPEENRTILQQLLPEAMYEGWHTETDQKETIILAAGTEKTLRKSLDWADIVILGPGMTTAACAEQLVELTLCAIAEDTRTPVIIDADALNILARRTDLWGLLDRDTVLTPHVGELARLSGKMTAEVKRSLPETALELAGRTGANIVAKDCVTVIVEQDAGEDCALYLNTSGCGAMAKAGSGDLLTGVIAGAYAVTGNFSDAIAAGVYLHGLAGECAARHLGEHSTLARDIADALGEAMRTAAERSGSGAGKRQNRKR